jgi:hypothetical protein
MKVDGALAAGLDREIKQRRADALAADPRSSYWTDRDVARRMTEAGHRIQHPAVIRARQGDRAITVEEWLTFAYVLSLPPHKLLESDEPLSIGAADDTPLQHDNKAVRDWLAGIRPLEGVDRAIFYSTITAAGPAKRSVFAGQLRAKANQFDTATDSDERWDIADTVAAAALGQARTERALQRAQRERGARPRKVPMAKVEFREES